MVHKNYKWNLSEENGRTIVYTLIETILKEKNDMTIELNELTFLLNNRTKHMDITNNNKNKNINNYIKVVFGGLINFVDDYDKFLLQMTDNSTLVKINNWVAY